MKKHSCMECGAEVIEDDSHVYLDTPAVKWDGGRAQWTLMNLGGRVIASTGDPSPDGTAHTLHEHQPPDGPMA